MQPDEHFEEEEENFQGEVVELGEDDAPMSDAEDEKMEDMQETTINDFLQDDSIQGFFDHQGTDYVIVGNSLRKRTRV